MSEDDPIIPDPDIAALFVGPSVWDDPKRRAIAVRSANAVIDRIRKDIPDDEELEFAIACSIVRAETGA